MWTYQGKEFTVDDVEDNYGFVYEITCKRTGQGYIGKKFFTKAGTRQVKGKKRKCRKPSDWPKYWGSSKQLVDLVKELGEDQFEREILMLCKTRGETGYQEARIQFERNVLKEKLPSGEYKYFNGIINVRVGRNSVDDSTP